MKRLPEGFAEEYREFRERFDWLARKAEEDVASSRLVYEQNRAFLQRWRGKTGIPEFEQGFTKLWQHIERLGFLLEAKYLETLADLLEKRHSVLVEPLIFQMTVAFIKTILDAPETMRPTLEGIFREHIGYDFDAERFYRESEAAEETYDAEYRRAFGKMEVDWAERFDSPTHARLAGAPIEEINQWKAEVAALLEATNAKIVRLEGDDPTVED